MKRKKIANQIDLLEDEDEEDLYNDSIKKYVKEIFNEFKSDITDIKNDLNKLEIEVNNDNIEGISCYANDAKSDLNALLQLIKYFKHQFMEYVAKNREVFN